MSAPTKPTNPTDAGVVPAEVHERGWQWRPVTTDTAFAPPFGTIRECRVCGCLVTGGPTLCVRCGSAGVPPGPTPTKPTMSRIGQSTAVAVVMVLALPAIVVCTAFEVWASRRRR